ncbi:MAG: CRTAC1 family protein [Hyphomonadaceae bacterium]|nr:CRTAC1 family protein [Hyphomonadaceae bacterium]
MRLVLLAAVGSLPLLLAACATHSAPSSDLARACGIVLAPAPLVVGDGSRDRGFPGGVSLVDVDGDGDLDLMATGGYSPVARPLRYRPNTLYINDGAGRFSHASDAEFTVADNANSGSTWGDVDGDGDPDAFISTQHGRPDIFLRNAGGRFTRAALGAATTTPGSNFAASWVDIDGDGDLDLTSGGPTLEPGAPMLIFRNDEGAFVRVTDLPIENGASNGGAVLWADFDNDGDPDLLVANSDVQRRSDMAPATYESPQLYRNDGAWRFSRMEGQSFDAIAFASSVAAAGDIDNDGDLDLYFANFAGASYIFLNDGAGRFARDPRFAAPSHEGWGTGAAFVDFDLDGDLDLVGSGYEWGILLWRNDGAGAFVLDETPALRERVATYSGAASGDIDGDGDLDLVLGNWGETEAGDFVTVLANQSTPCGTPLRLRLRDRHGAADPLNARVTLITRGGHGERRQMREAMAQSTFRSQSADAFLFAVPHGERIVRAEVRWPDGRIQHIRRFTRQGATSVTEPAA